MLLSVDCDCGIIVSFIITISWQKIGILMLFRFKNNEKIRIHYTTRVSRSCCSAHGSEKTLSRGVAARFDLSFPRCIPEGTRFVEVEEFNNGRGRVARRRALLRRALRVGDQRRLRSFIGILQVVRQVWPAFVMRATRRWAIQRDERGEIYPSLLSNWSATTESRMNLNVVGHTYAYLPTYVSLSTCGRHDKLLATYASFHLGVVSPPGTADRFRPIRVLAHLCCDIRE